MRYLHFADWSLILMDLSRWQIIGLIAVFRARACEQTLGFTVHDNQPLLTRRQPSLRLSLEDSSSNHPCRRQIPQFFPVEASSDTERPAHDAQHANGGVVVKRIPPTLPEGDLTGVVQGKWGFDDWGAAAPARAVPGEVCPAWILCLVTPPWGRVDSGVLLRGYSNPGTAVAASAQNADAS